MQPVSDPVDPSAAKVYQWRVPPQQGYAPQQVHRLGSLTKTVSNERTRPGSQPPRTVHIDAIRVHIEDVAVLPPHRDAHASEIGAKPRDGCVEDVAWIAGQLAVPDSVDQRLDSHRALRSQRQCG